MPTVPELLDGHVTLEVECLDRLYLNGYIGKTGDGDWAGVFMGEGWTGPLAGGAGTGIGTASRGGEGARSGLLVPSSCAWHKGKPKPSRPKDQRAIPSRAQQNGLREPLLFLH